MGRSDAESSNTGENGLHDRILGQSGESASKDTFGDIHLVSENDIVLTQMYTADLKIYPPGYQADLLLTVKIVCSTSSTTSTTLLLKSSTLLKFTLIGFIPCFLSSKRIGSERASR
jgi:hypothetical protein